MKKLKILIVDDNPHFVNALRFMLLDYFENRIESIFTANDGSFQNQTAALIGSALSAGNGGAPGLSAANGVFGRAEYTGALGTEIIIGINGETFPGAGGCAVCAR